MRKQRRIGRRKFLKNSALVGAGLTLAGGLPTVPGLSGTPEALDTTSGGAVELLCEYAMNPIGIDVLLPRFSWKVQPGRRGWAQSAYQILVATSEERLTSRVGDKWDSGKITS